MVNGVVVEFVEDDLRIVRLDHYDPVFTSSDGEPLDDGMDLGDVRKDVSSHHHVGVSSISNNRLGYVDAEEIGQRGNTVSVRLVRDVAGWLDSENRPASLREPPKKRSIVAGNLDHRTSISISYRLPQTRNRLHPLHKG